MIRLTEIDLRKKRSSVDVNDDKFKFKDKKKLSQFKKRHNDLRKRLKQRLTNEKNQKEKDKNNKRMSQKEDKDEKYNKMTQIKEQHKQNPQS